MATNVYRDRHRRGERTCEHFLFLSPCDSGTRAKTFKTRTTAEGEGVSSSAPAPFSCLERHVNGRGPRLPKSLRRPFSKFVLSVSSPGSQTTIFSFRNILGFFLTSAGKKSPLRPSPPSATGKPSGAHSPVPLLRSLGRWKLWERTEDPRSPQPSTRWATSQSRSVDGAARRGPFKSRPRPSPPPGAAGGRWRPLRC